MATQLARAEFVTLDAERRGYYALPTGKGPFPAVLLYPEAFGCNDYVQSECRKLADNGYAAMSPDIFRGECFGYTDMEKVMAKMSTFTDEGLMADVRAGLAFLDKQAEVRKGPVGCMGFCMGGRMAFLTAAELGDRIGAAVPFYGGGISPDKPRPFQKPLLDRVPDIKAPVMFQYGADDGGISPSEHARIAQAMSENKKAYSLNVFPGAGHGFASVDRASSYNKDVADLAWKITLFFFKNTLG